MVTHKERNKPNYNMISFNSVLLNIDFSVFLLHFGFGLFLFRQRLAANIGLWQVKLFGSIVWTRDFLRGKIWHSNLQKSRNKKWKWEKEIENISSQKGLHFFYLWSHIGWRERRKKKNSESKFLLSLFYTFFKHIFFVE